MDKHYETPYGKVTVREPYYLASCDGCGWIGSSEECGGDDYFGDSDVSCPKCYRAGCDCGSYAEKIENEERAALIREDALDSN